MDEQEDEAVGTFEERMLEQAQRQTKVLETLRAYAFSWTVAAGLGVFLWVMFALNR